MKNLICYIFLFLHFLFIPNLIAQVNPDLTFTSCFTGFSSPVDIANAGDGSNRLFVLERGGMIKVIENDVVLPTPFLDISDRISCCGERGVLGLVFHPNYSSNGYFYVNYTDDTGGDTRISRFEVSAADPNVANPNSEVVLLEIHQPYGNHNAGDLNFGPIDGYLYIALGDGGSGGDPQNRSQNESCLLGKMLRIDVDGGGLPASASQGGFCEFTSSGNYTIPADNPFVGQSALNEIWSIGLRNPWRFAFDAANGNMWIADVGQNDWEEVNFELSGDGGKNYGWRCYEGNHTYNTSGCGAPSDYVDAVFEYDHSASGGYSITGGYVYRGAAYPNLVGHYIVADFATNNFWTLLRAADGTITSISHDILASNISSFGEGEDGEMFVASLNGPIYKVEDLSPLPLELSSFTGKSVTGVNQLSWITLTETNTAYFEIERSNEGRTFDAIGQVNAKENSIQKTNYYFEDKSPDDYENYYRLKMVDQDETFRYSPVIHIESATSFSFSILPNPNDGRFALLMNSSARSNLDIKVYNAKGKLILSEKMYQNLNRKEFDLSGLLSGIYILEVSSGSAVFTEKIVIR